MMSRDARGAAHETTADCGARVARSRRARSVPNYKRPEVKTPAEFRGQAAPLDGKSLADLAWWELYRDPVLDKLIKTALAQNYDVRIAIVARRRVSRVRRHQRPWARYRTIVGGRLRDALAHYDRRAQSAAVERGARALDLQRRDRRVLRNRSVAAHRQSQRGGARRSSGVRICARRDAGLGRRQRGFQLGSTCARSINSCS